MTTYLNGTVEVDRTPWAGMFPMDAGIPITAVHLGIEYAGEVVGAARWSAGLDQAPGDGSHFKIVLLQNPPRLDRSKIAGRNLAVCAPSPQPGRQAHQMIGEITAAKQAAYLTRRDIDAAAINSAPRERQDNLGSQLIAEESARHSEGSIYVQDAPGTDPSNIYIGDDPMDWMENLAGWLLARSYPSLPVNAHTLPQPVFEDDIGELFASIFGQTGKDGDLLCSLDPALGLSSPDSDCAYDSSNCPLFPIIRGRISGGPANFGELHRYLAHEVGLTGGLASMFLTLFVHDEHPEPPYSWRTAADC